MVAVQGHQKLHQSASVWRSFALAPLALFGTPNEWQF
jgi:hypothetical protein